MAAREALKTIAKEVQTKREDAKKAEEELEQLCQEKAQEEINRMKQKQNVTKVYVRKPKDATTEREDSTRQPSKQAVEETNLEHLTRSEKMKIIEEVGRGLKPNGTSHQDSRALGA